MNGLPALALRLAITLVWPGLPQAAANSPPVAFEQHLSEGSTTVTLTVDRTRASIAETIRYTIRVEADDQLSAEFDSVGEQLGPFRIDQYHPFGPVGMPGARSQWQREYLLSPTTPGLATIPSIAVHFFAASGECVSASDCELSAHGRRTHGTESAAKKLILRTDPVNVTIDTILPDDADVTRPRDILAPFDLAVSQNDGTAAGRWIWLVAGVGSIALLALGLIRRRPRELSTGPSSLPDDDPGARALHALSELKARDLLGQGLHEAYHSRLNAVLRHYLAAGFQIPALEMTTGEILKAVADHAELKVHQQEIAAMLARHDLAKFAHRFPSIQDSIEMIDQTEILIRRSQEEARTDDSLSTG